MCICTRTYRHSRPPRALHTGSAGDRRMGSLSQVSPVSHSESRVLPKEEGAGEKKRAGLWSVTLWLLPHPPSPRLNPSSSQGGVSPAPPRPGRGGLGARAASAERNLHLCVCTRVTVCEHSAGKGTHVHLCPLGSQPRRGLGPRKPPAGMVTPV